MPTLRHIAVFREVVFQRTALPQVLRSGSALGKKIVTLLDLCVSSLRRGHANLLCIVPILADDPRRESAGKGRPWNKARSRKRVCRQSSARLCIVSFPRCCEAALPVKRNLQHAKSSGTRTRDGTRMHKCLLVEMQGFLRTKERERM